MRQSVRFLRVDDLLSTEQRSAIRRGLGASRLTEALADELNRMPEEALQEALDCWLVPFALQDQRDRPARIADWCDQVATGTVEQRWAAVAALAERSEGYLRFVATRARLDMNSRHALGKVLAALIKADLLPVSDRHERHQRDLWKEASKEGSKKLQVLDDLQRAHVRRYEGVREREEAVYVATILLQQSRNAGSHDRTRDLFGLTDPLRAFGDILALCALVASRSIARRQLPMPHSVAEPGMVASVEPAPVDGSAGLVPEGLPPSVVVVREPSEPAPVGRTLLLETPRQQRPAPPDAPPRRGAPFWRLVAAGFTAAVLAALLGVGVLSPKLDLKTAELEPGEQIVGEAAPAAEDWEPDPGGPFDPSEKPSPLLGMASTLVPAPGSKEAESRKESQICDVVAGVQSLHLVAPRFRVLGPARGLAEVGAELSAREVERRLANGAARQGTILIASPDPASEALVRPSVLRAACSSRDVVRFNPDSKQLRRRLDKPPGGRLALARVAGVEDERNLLAAALRWQTALPTALLATGERAAAEVGLQRFGLTIEPAPYSCPELLRVVAAWSAIEPRLVETLVRGGGFIDGGEESCRVAPVVHSAGGAHSLAAAMEASAVSPEGEGRASDLAGWLAGTSVDGWDRAAWQRALALDEQWVRLPSGPRACQRWVETNEQALAEPAVARYVIGLGSGGRCLLEVLARQPEGADLADLAGSGLGVGRHRDQALRRARRQLRRTRGPRLAAIEAALELLGP